MSTVSPMLVPFREWQTWVRVTTPDEPQPSTDIDAHRKSLLQVFRIKQI